MQFKVNPEQERAKRRAASASLAFNLLSTAVKLVGAVLTGSVSLLSEAAHSGTDVVASFIALVSVRAAALPPDEEHPYGHGKIESLAGFAEAILLLLIVAYIAVEAVSRLFTKPMVERLDVGLVIMICSSLGSLFVSKYVAKVGERARSAALRSNAQHLMIDFWTSVGVVIALGFTRVTGIVQADSVLAMGLAIWLARGAWHLSQNAFHELIDHRLSDEDVAAIRAVVEQHPGLLSYHRMRTRLSGNMRYIDMHIVVPNDWSVVQAHQCADALEKAIERDLAPAQAVIHVDPFDEAKT